jgi:hypothetical protein
MRNKGRAGKLMTHGTKAIGKFAVFGVLFRYSRSI